MLHVHFLDYGVCLCHGSGVVLVVKWSVGFHCLFCLMVSSLGSVLGLGRVRFDAAMWGLVAFTLMRGCVRGQHGMGPQCSYEVACSKVDNYLC